MERDNLMHGARTALNTDMDIRAWAENYLKEKTRGENTQMSDEEFEKHWRYIKFEGEARYKKGERFSWQIWLRQTVRALKQSLIDAKGLQAGFTGVFLSVFYAWYVCMSLLSLRQYQRAI